ncbi:DUF835 domain-containing protein [Thermococcus sp. 21S9]|uniref:DUF835 domain-containing protein n=1 Tax=Thermococcus sp. 21S9 TaxID=1638223 RepID=UPI00143AAF66|nr:DUF835 domain-containing protein [Thermococcus sp. 21S9]NJE53720.1 DUF835 domain-containing protein [Thermococcus sp. 21S9]
MLLKGKIRRGPQKVLDYRVLPSVLKALPDRKVLITRKMPEEVPDSNIIHIWVTRVRHPQAVDPTNLYVIEQRVWDSLSKGAKNVILDAFEYLLLENGLERTLRFVGKLRDMALLSDSNFYVTVSDGVDERVLAMLKRIVE